MVKILTRNHLPESHFYWNCLLICLQYRVGCFWMAWLAFWIFKALLQLQQSNSYSTLHWFHMHSNLIRLLIFVVCNFEWKLVETSLKIAPKGKTHFYAPEFKENIVASNAGWSHLDHIAALSYGQNLDTQSSVRILWLLELSVGLSTISSRLLLNGLVDVLLEIRGSVAIHFLPFIASLCDLTKYGVWFVACNF